jgi:hypothetical protein
MVNPYSFTFLILIPGCKGFWERLGSEWQTQRKPEIGVTQPDSFVVSVSLDGVILNWFCNFWGASTSS